MNNAISLYGLNHDYNMAFFKFHTVSILHLKGKYGARSESRFVYQSLDAPQRRELSHRNVRC